MLKNHIANINLNLRLLKLIVEPLGLILNHLTGEQRDKLLLSDLGEELLVKDTLVDKLTAG